MAILYFLFSAIIGAALAIGWVGWVSEYYQRKNLEQQIEELKEDLWKAENESRITKMVKNLTSKQK